MNKKDKSDKGDCYCEDPQCNFYPLENFEKCPKCESKAYHRPRVPYTTYMEEKYL